MSTHSAVKEKFASLPSAKAKLLQLLLEERARQKYTIAHCDRTPDENGLVRVPASSAQHRLWFIDQLGNGGRAYHIAVGFRLRGRLYRAGFERALNLTVSRHEALRTVFVSLDGFLYQEVSAEGTFPLVFTDLSGYSAEHCEERLSAHKVAESQNGFNLRTGPLIRGQLLRLQSEEHVLLVTMHHIVSDGWSTGVFFNDLWELYELVCQGRSSPLTPPAIQYLDYTQWQHSWLDGDDHKRKLAYWTTQLQGAPTQLQLPTTRPRPAAQSYNGENMDFVLDAEVSGRLKAFAKQQEMTLFMILYAGWAILLSRLSGQQDVVIGTPVLGRSRPELKRVVGLFVNTLPLRVEVNGSLQLTKFLRRVREVTVSGYDHQDVPLDRMIEALQPERSLSRNPLFQVMFALQNPAADRPQVAELLLTGETGVDELAMVDVVLSLQERGNELVGTVNFAADLFDRETILCWISSYIVLLQGMLEEPGRRIAELPILPLDQFRRVTEVFNSTRTSCPLDRSIHELFEAQVTRTPDAIAVLYGDQSLTYEKINVLANKLACHLRKSGLQKGEYVLIFMPRCLDMVVAQIAVLKCGCAYVPLDPRLPGDRKAFVIRNSEARWALTTGNELREVPGFQSVQWLDCSLQNPVIAAQVADNPPDSVNPEFPAYVMYTSGSTGTPKGVIVPHRAVVRLVINNAYANIETGDCIAHYSNPAFDASTFEIWGALLNGACVLIISEDVVLDVEHFAWMLTRHSVTVLWMTAGLLNQYAKAMPSVFRRLRYFLCGGDVVEPGVFAWLLNHCSPMHLLNAYGPTETTTFATTYRAEAVVSDAKSVPIGRPIANTQVYILDQELRPVPIGVSGEIYVGGKGVALGYLKEPRLTAERFLKDPFSHDPHDRIYKTGDMGRWTPEGVVEYLGRNDRQVKIRGFRVELGEVEAQLARCPSVKEVVVMANRDSTGGKQLVAYVTAASNSARESLTTEQLRLYGRSIMPDYMVPSAFVLLESLPLTANGKVDRKALPQPTLESHVGTHYEAPQGKFECALAEIWRELLGVERVGREDSFFDLGGHSLLVLRLLFRLRDAFGKSLKAGDAYGNPTLREMAARLGGGVVQSEWIVLSNEATLEEKIVRLHGNVCSPPNSILLTGCTGFVGRFLLTQLLEETRATIYCLIRAKSTDLAMVRLEEMLVKWDLWRGDYRSRIVAIAGDLSAPRLASDEQTYELLASRVDSVYHCATSMNHLESFAMARPANVDGINRLLDLVTQLKPKVLNYISTLSVFNSPITEQGRIVREDSPIDDETHFTHRGYAASKWVAEKIVMMAGERGVPCNIFRLGLVWADSVRGRYDELQREYRLLKSSLLIGYGIKDYRFESVPTPVDYVARAIVFLASTHPGGGGVFHVSASLQSVSDIFESCNRVANTSLEIVSTYQWISEVKRLHYAGLSLPITPLVEFAFSMDERSFDEYERLNDCQKIHFDCSRTHAELEAGGIYAPVFKDELLEVCIADMFCRDRELRIRTGRRELRTASVTASV